MKKLIILLGMAVVIILGAVVPALASNQDFQFYMTVGGASAHSASTWKTDGENAWYVTPKIDYPYNSDWIDGETLVFRARFADGSIAANAYSKVMGQTAFYNTTFHEPYIDSTPAYHIYYRLYASKPYSDPYDFCNVGGTWCP